MMRLPGPARSAPLLLAFAFLASAPAAAQRDPDGFVTGQVSAAWEKWQAAMKAILARDAAAADTAFGELVALAPSPMRIALMAEHTVMRTADGGAVLLLDQDAKGGSLPANSATIAAQLEIGREQLKQADDGWYFASVGRFDIADANFKALLEAEPDPVALLEFADRVRPRHEVLVQLSDNAVVGETARKIIRVLEQGERLIKSDPVRVKAHIDRLVGAPRQFENAVASLRESGEYAIPFLIQYLRDPGRTEFTQPILRAMPLIDRPALNPLVMALRVGDGAIQRYVVQSLGQIGYAQSVPYLLKLRDDSETPAEVRASVGDALSALQTRGVVISPGGTAAQAFYDLADGYYRNVESLAADPRLDTANVWYWKDDVLQNVEVPTAIFDEVMTMRCCEEALRLDPSMKPALALWLAANFRREAQLASDALDRTRPENTPSAAYFAQSAGPAYCTMALARAVDDKDPVVALGAIEALRRTGGPASIVGEGQGRQPLAEALTFPDRMVRIRAALALGASRPAQQFQNYQNLIPVLAEALVLHAGSRSALVIDPQADTGNAVATALRANGYEVVLDTGLLTGLEKARTTLAGVDVVMLASDVQNPALQAAVQQIRSGGDRFGNIPVILVAKPADRTVVRDLVRGDLRLGRVTPEDSPEHINKVIGDVARAVGANPVDAAAGSALALEAAAVLHGLGASGTTTFDLGGAEAALVKVVEAGSPEHRTAAAGVLAFVRSAGAQEAIAKAALADTETPELRSAMFEALAQAAKNHGSMLGDESVQKIIAAVEKDANLVIRTAASQALGAMNLASDPASTIIRNQYGG